MNISNFLGIIAQVSSQIRTIIITFAIAAVVFGIIQFCMKYESARICVGTIALALYISFTIFALVNIVTYYNARGGIFGKIDEIPKLPENDLVIDENNLKFDFENISLKEVEGGYSASITHSAVIDLENATYTILVNGTPVGECENSTDYILGKYTYTFYNSSKNEILTDTLTISIAFNGLGTECVLTTAGNGEVVKYWNYYFIKNGFTVTVDRGGYIKPDNSSVISIGQAKELMEEVSTLRGVVSTFSNNVETTKQQVSNYMLQDSIDNSQLEEYIISFNEYISNAIEFSTQNAEFSARLSAIREEYAQLLLTNLELSSKLSTIDSMISQISQSITTATNTSNNYIDVIRAKIESNVILINYSVDGSIYSTQTIVQGTAPFNPIAVPDKSGYKTLGWSIDGINVINPATTPFYTNTTLIALYEEYVNITYISNGEIVGTQSIENGMLVTGVNVEKPDNYDFIGWTTIESDSNSLINLETTPITENVILYALFGHTESVQLFSLIYGQSMDTGNITVFDRNVLTLLENKGLSTNIDLSKCSFKILFYESNGYMQYYENFYITIDGSNLNETVATPDFPSPYGGYNDKGTAYISITSDGDIIYDPGTFEVNWGSGSYTKWYNVALNNAVPQNIYFLTSSF